MLCGAMVLTCTGCKNTNAYAVEIVRGTNYEDVSGVTEASDRVISIGDSSYSVKWEKSVRSNLNDELYDYYEVIDSQDKFLPGTIKIDPKTGEVLYFSQIAPFSRIDNMDSLSDDELRSAAEQMLGGLADFSRYNMFEVIRPIGTNTDITLKWQVKRDILCRICVIADISEDGEIISFEKVNACPDGTAESYIPKDERIKLLEEGICEELGIRSLDGSGYKYNILHERMSYFHNKVCVTYSVEIRDKQDFGFVISVMVYKR